MPWLSKGQPKGFNWEILNNF